MKYGQTLSARMAPEWKDAYVDYRILKLLLKPLGYLAEEYFNIDLHPQDTKDENHDQMSHSSMINLSNEDLDYLTSFHEKFEYMIWSEFEKVTAFFKTKLKEYLVKFQHFKVNIEIISAMKNDPEYQRLWYELKNCFHLYYKEISTLSEYHAVNYESLRMILKKQKKLCNAFPKKFLTPLKLETFFNENSFLHKNISKLTKLKKEVKSLYLDFFYGADKHEGKTNLAKISQRRLISDWENFYFGLFSGFIILLLIIILVLGKKGNLDPDQDIRFNHIFHIYRGLALFIMYIWLLGWNVYGWTQYHINYKLIFKFNHHYSTLSEIWKRAAFFTTVCLLMFLSYVIFREKGEEIKDVSLYDYVNKEIYPLIFWIIFWGYIFFPSIKYFNGEGRFYMLNLLKRMVSSSCFFVDFTLVWATIQTLSFAIPLRDFEYTICYYVHRIWLDSHVEVCYSQEKAIIAFMSAGVPLLIRIIQCLRSMYQKEKRFCLNQDFFNMIKYIVAMIAVFLSFYIALYPFNEIVFWGWIIFASFSTIYSYYWDVKLDWGFFDPKAKHKYLRSELSYDNLYFYYIAIASNFVLRFSWILSLSSGIVEKSMMRKELFTFLLGFLEMIRRAIWNFFTVEKEHIKNMGLFRIVENYKLPFENIKIDDKQMFLMDFDNSFDKEDVEKESFIIDSENSLDLNELKDRIKGSPMYTLTEIKEEIEEFKKFIRARKSLVIKEKDKESILKKTNQNQNAQFNNSYHLQTEDLKFDENKKKNDRINRQKNKLHRSIAKYLEIDGKESFSNKNSLGLGIVQFRNADRSSFEIEEKKRKNF